MLRSVGAVQPHLAGRFRDVRAFEQTVAGHYLVFDQRAHTVFVLDQSLTSVWPLVQIGTQPGRIIGDGDKIRAVQFRGAGILAPASLSFRPNSRLLVTPGLYEFVPG